ncbi:MAG: hypothetical protein ACLSWA_10350 [Thomasclavelia spiroformis]
MFMQKNITSQVWLIYPVNTEFYGDKIIVLDSEDRVKVSLFLIDLTSVESEVERLLKLLF